MAPRSKFERHTRTESSWSRPRAFARLDDAARIYCAEVVRQVIAEYICRDGAKIRPEARIDDITG